MRRDTIAAIATPRGTGSVGVVRISGEQAGPISRAVTGRTLTTRVATFCEFSDADGSVLDVGIGILFRAPKSFTGEDILELQGHGSPVVLDLLLARCLQLGARMARAGEFSERAFLNGKLDLAQAEAVADLIESSTALAAKLSARSLQGVFSRRVRKLLDSLIELRSLVEATLDFPDDEIPSDKVSPLKGRVDVVISYAERVLSDAHQGERIRDGVTVVIAGRTNAGKSHLLNTLTESEPAIVSTAPGTTRDLLRCDIQIDGLAVRLVDTAGIRETVEPVEQEGVRRARAQFLLADHVLWVHDNSLKFDPSELAEVPAGIPVTVILNKVDLAAVSNEPQQPCDRPQIFVSALTGFGIDSLREHLRTSNYTGAPNEGDFVARRRHLDALRRGLVSLHSAKTVLDLTASSEVLAFELGEAQRAFGEITGDFTPENLLDHIFSTFCIGK